MKKLILTFLSCILSVVLISASGIDYKNKALSKTLKKNGILDLSIISEIDVNDSIKKQYNLQGKYFIINSDVSNFKYIYTGRVNSCRAGGCSISVHKQQQDTSEYFDYFIIFDKKKTIQLVKVFNYKATHGHEISAKGWLKQFIGFDGSKPLQVDKDIDAISGATISVYAITYDIDLKTQFIKSKY